VTLLGRSRGRLPGRRVLAGLALAALVTIGVVVATTTFTGGGSASGAGNPTPTSLARVTRQSLSSQTFVSATLGYAAASNVVMPAGTAAAGVLQAQQSAAQAEAALRTARASLATDRSALERARATLQADRAKQATECRGDSAAQSTSNGSTNADAGACASAHQAVVTDEQSVAAAVEKVAADKRAVSDAQAGLAGPVAGLAVARASATAYNTTSTYTMLPTVGQVVRRGQALYAVDGKPGLLLYGAVTAWRAFVSGMSPGRDVAALNANLRALGYGDATGDAFSSATRAAIMSLQRTHGLEPTGELLLGAVIFKSGPVRVTTVQATLGGAVQPGVALAVSSTRRIVTIALDASQQSLVKVGDRATITLPDNRATPGVISSVGSVATTPSSDSSGGQTQPPTVEVEVTPSDPEATGRLDQAPVQVSITTASVENALVVPVNALVALAGGGYAVETVDAAGTHRLVAVGLGLFDDSQGLVQVTDTSLTAGRRVMVPTS
jgi:peptidoglycan hydrolase-like protein with peptidoglycan-binding domain